MSLFRFIFLSFLVSFMGCQQDSSISSKPELTTAKESVKVNSHASIKGALLSTRFKSLEDLESVVQIEYTRMNPLSGRKPSVQLTHSNNDSKVVSILKSGVSEADFRSAAKGGFWDKVRLVIDSPYFAIYRNDMLRIYNLSRRREFEFGKDDVAFYDLAETMMFNISDDDIVAMPSEDISEKGFLNTFNHITAQAFMTSIFSEKLADFVADTHERRNLPEMITGDFTEEQLNDLAKGPVDNYVDMINNEWGQELGKELAKKYDIKRNTVWTPELLTVYLNDIQAYYSWAFQIGFKPFKPTDEVVKIFSKKINKVMTNQPGMKLIHKT